MCYGKMFWLDEKCSVDTTALVSYGWEVGGRLPVTLSARASSATSKNLIPTWVYDILFLE